MNMHSTPPLLPRRRARPIGGAALSALLLGATALPAQTSAPRPTAPPRPRPHFPIHAESVGPRTELWACGNDYKVRFGDDVTFVPRLGAAAPVDAEFHWRLLGLFTAGGDALATSAAVDTRCDRFHAERDHGFVRERYDVLAHGLEQSFVLPQRPNWAGDLELRGAISGNLVGGDTDAVPGRAAPRRGSIPFRDPSGNVVVDYGAALAIDARGHRTPLVTELADGAIRIRLPADLLAAAEYPLTVDPIVTPVLIAISGIAGETRAAAMARTTATTIVPLAYAEIVDYSGTDRDMYLASLDDQGQNQTPLFGSFAMSISEESLDLAVADAGNRWLLVFERAGATNPLYYLARDVQDTTFDITHYPLSCPSGFRHASPRVGGSTTGSTKNALIVREQYPAGSTTGRIVASLLDVRTLHEATPVTLSGTQLFSTAAQPAVAKDAAGLAWLCAWQQSSTLSPGYRVVVKRIDVFGNVAAQQLTSDRASIPVHEIAPRIDGAAGRHTLWFGEVDRNAYPGLVTGGDSMALRAMRIDWPALGTPTTQPSQEVDARTTRTLTANDTAFDARTRSHWFLAYRDAVATDLRVAVTGMHGALLRRDVLHLGTSAARGARATLAFAPTDWAVRSLYTVTTIASDELYIGAVIHPDNPSSAYGTPACGGAANVVTGRFLRGNEFAALELQNAPPSQPAVLFLSSAAAALPLAGLDMPGCVALVDVGAGLIAAPLAVTTANGTAAITIALPESLPTFDVFAQWLYLAPGANPFGALTSYGLQVRVR